MAYNTTDIPHIIAVVRECIFSLGFLLALTECSTINDTRKINIRNVNMKLTFPEIFSIVIFYLFISYMLFFFYKKKNFFVEDLKKKKCYYFFIFYIFNDDDDDNNNILTAIIFLEHCPHSSGEHSTQSEQ